MKSKQRFIWVYSTLLFAGAILLILISALSQSRVSPGAAGRVEVGQQAFNQTIQKSVAELTLENERQSAKLKAADEKITALENKIVENEDEIHRLTALTETANMLMRAEMSFNTGKYAESRDRLSEVDRDILSDVSLYDWLRSKLQTKGFKIQEVDENVGH